MLRCCGRCGLAALLFFKPVLPTLGLCLQTYEHPQNVLLLRLINGNLDLQGVHRDVPAGLTPEEAAQAQLGKSLRLWLDLQNSLNALIDSNAGVG